MSDTMLTLGAPIRSIRAIVPAYNEQGNLADVVQVTLEALHDITPTFELVIVNDGSSDATRRIAEECASAHANVMVVHHARRLGLGAAWRAGYVGAAAQFILFVDGDRQYDPLELERIAHWGDAYDLMAGYRIRRADGIPRRTLGLLYRLIARTYLHVKARDVTCGLLLVRTSVLQRMALQCDGMTIHAELRFRAQQLSARIREVAIHHYPRRRGRSTGARPRTILKAIRETRGLKKRLADEERERSTDAREASPRAKAEPASTFPDPGEVADPPIAGAS